MGISSRSARRALAGGVFAAAVVAAAVPAEGRAQEFPTRQVISPDRFGRFEENFGIAHRMQNNGWADADEWAIRARYSFKYSVYRFGAAGWLGGRQSELFLSYTGEFDFYMGTRPSGPVINRVSNPALHFRLCRDCGLPAWDTWFDLGVEHRSNGQVGDVETPTGAARAQAAYGARDRPFFDQISRGSNYVSVTAYSTTPLGIDAAALRVRAKLYFTRDSDVTWGPLAGRGTSIADYDRVSLAWRHELPSIGRVRSRLEAEWTIGDRGLATDSLTVGLHLNINRWLPLYLRAHAGPMNTLSNYTQRQDSIGIGLRFDD